MKTFKTNTRYNLSKNQNEVNCEGFFNSDFFTLIELKKRQDAVYNLYLEDNRYSNEYSCLYEALEHMRIALIK